MIYEWIMTIALAIGIVIGIFIMFKMADGDKHKKGKK